MTHIIANVKEKLLNLKVIKVIVFKILFQG